MAQVTFWPINIAPRGRTVQRARQETILTQPRPVLLIGHASDLSEKKAKPPTPHILPFAQLLSHRGVKNSATAHAPTGASFPRATVELRLGGCIIPLLVYLYSCVLVFATEKLVFPNFSSTSLRSIFVTIPRHRDIHPARRLRYSIDSVYEYTSGRLP